ncbi:MAG TPA: adenine phosphoribosyltransferase [bacterium]|nr:adenine phosphoribosyltransferase [bacterium]
MNAAGRLKSAIRDIPGFPKSGIVFKDITPILANPELFREVLDRFQEHWKHRMIDVVVGIEARGFILGGAVADRLGAGFVPVRKKGKLPWKTERVEYALEYGTDCLEMHQDGVHSGQRVLIVDDLLATGGTAEATARLIEKNRATVAGMCFLVNLAFLPGARRLSRYEIQSLIEFDEE